MCVQEVVSIVKPNFSTMRSLCQRQLGAQGNGFGHPLQGLGSSKCAIESCPDTLRWDNIDLARSFLIT